MEFDSAGTATIFKYNNTIQKEKFGDTSGINNFRFRNNKIYCQTSGVSVVEINIQTKQVLKHIVLGNLSAISYSGQQMWDVSPSGIIYYQNPSSGSYAVFNDASGNSGKVFRYDSHASFSQKGVLAVSDTEINYFNNSSYNSNQYFGFHSWNPSTNTISAYRGCQSATVTDEFRKMKYINSKYYYCGNKQESSQQHIAGAAKSSNSTTFDQHVRFYGDSSSYQNVAYDITEDIPTGDWYVCGYERRSTATYYGGVLIKINSAGTIQWSKRYTVSTNNVQITGVASDSTGLYVAGHADTIGVFIAKLSKTDGTITWIKSLNSNQLTNLEVDSTNNKLLFCYVVNEITGVASINTDGSDSTVGVLVLSTPGPTITVGNMISTVDTSTALNSLSGNWTGSAVFSSLNSNGSVRIL